MNLFWSLLLATALAALAFWRRALTTGGLLLAWALAVIIAYCAGLWAFAALTAVFLCTIAAGKISAGVRSGIEQNLHAKTGQRDATQIFCNVFTAALMATGYDLSKWNGFLWACGGALSASLADSMASELGILSKTPPQDICTLRPVAPGLSGGVTVLGLAASLLGAFIPALLLHPGGRAVVALTLSGFLAALFDSVLGSRLQAKYRCSVCGALTEKPVHCSRSGQIERGLAFVTNDWVNLCNNLFGALAAIIFYIL